MASRVLLISILFTAMALHIMGYPSQIITEEDKQEALEEESEEVLMEPSVHTEMASYGRNFNKVNLTTKFSLDGTLAGAPNGTASFNFIPLGTFLLAGVRRWQNLIMG